MIKAASRQPLKADARVRSYVSPREVHDGQSGTGTAGIRNLRFSTVSIIKPKFYNPFIYHRRCTSAVESVVK